MDGAGQTREVTPNANNGVARWGVLASWSGIILALVFGIGGAIGSAFALALQDTRLAVKGLQERELVNARDSGALTERIINHGASLRTLDETLQREMRLLDQAMEAKLVELDERLQAEIGRWADISKEEREELRRLVERIEAYQNSTRERNADQDARIRALEKEP
jgi:hypothetical protein